MPAWARQGLLLTVLALQLAWYAAIWFSGATHSWKVPWLAGAALAATLLLLWEPPWLAAAVRRGQADSARRPKLWLIGLGLLALAAGLWLVFNQRIWPFDEEGNLGASQLLAERGLGTFFAEYPSLPWLGRQHPPLAVLLNGLVMRLFGPELAYIRLVTLAYTLAAVGLTFWLGRLLYDRVTGLIAAAFLVAFPLVLRVGTVAMTDVQVMTYALLTICLVVKVERRPSWGLAAAAGFVFGLGLLTKYTIILVAPVIVAYFVINRSFRRCFGPLFVIGAISAAMLAAWLGYAYTLGVFAAQQELLGELAGSVTQADSGAAAFGSKLLLETVTTRLPSALGVYSAPFLLLGLVQIMRIRTRADWFLAAWSVIVGGLLLLTLPDHRYFMLMFPAAALIMARGVRTLPSLRRNALPLLSLCLFLCAGALYLFVDWERATHLFVR